ncbi:hypothetical protein TNIN_353501 [Trichonephila inaurata madagascariensis]|uniref:Uncharacterized protein n=1 Tax=Trichonephila inaurata madagascariensis TaxID=2747483 RepID=A0A8X6XBE8_9ARAC|nr:hypothetical protein TNIN_353501 [Trichonephila inaurata madagascariensis]
MLLTTAVLRSNLLFTEVMLIEETKAEDLRPGPEEGLLQSSWTQQGSSSPYNLRSRRDVTSKAASRPSGRAAQAQGGPVRSRREPFSRPSPYPFNHHRQYR